MRFVIEGAPRTKKTSNRVFRVGGKIRIVPSAAHDEWARAAIPQLQLQWARAARTVHIEHGAGRLSIGGPLQVPVTVRALVYRDADRGDLTGYMQAIADALERAGVIQNDRLIDSWDGTRRLIDRARPRVEIDLVPMEA